MIKILFTGGGGAGNEALWRLLEHRYILHFGDADPSSLDPIIPEDRRHKLPWAYDPDFVKKISELCQHLGIDLLIPGVDEELLALARNAEELAPTKLLLPSADYVEVMLDKLHMAITLSEKEISVPLSRTLDDDISDINFPCISKPRTGRGSRDVRILNSLEDAISLKSALGIAAHKILIQDKVDGVEYTVQMVADKNGRICAIVPVKVNLKRGITIRAETEAEPRVTAACYAIHKNIPTKGCYNIQLMLTAEGKVLPFEINPRVSTTLCLAVAAGIDPIAIFLEQVRCEDVLPFIEGVKLQRHWVNSIQNGILK